MSRRWIMVAGPYSTDAPDEASRRRNLEVLNEAALAITEKGHVPVIGVNMALPMIERAPDRADEIMMPISLALAERCDAVLRIGGASDGADAEVEAIRRRGGDVYRSLEEVPPVSSDEGTERKEMPTLRTKRLELRPFRLEDAADVQRLAGEWEIAYPTANIPHPYEEGMAEGWIGTHQHAFDSGRALTLAVTLASTGELVGAIGIHVNPTYRLAEIGYWIGRPYWNRGYCTEAAGEFIRHAFDAFDLNRIQARHMTRNPASGRIMEKLGMTREGVHRAAMHRWDRYDDLAIYSILREEHERS